MPLRPILKSLPSTDLSFISSSEAAFNPLPFSSCSTILDSHVHFPPTPRLTSTEITYSSSIYDRAPIVVAPNTCALPERGVGKLSGSNGHSTAGGLGYFHPHAMFQVDGGRVESSTSVTVGNINDPGSVESFMKRRSGPIYEYEYDQQPNHDQDTQHAQHVISSLIFDCSSESCTPPPPGLYVPTTSILSSSGIPHHSTSVNASMPNVYHTLTAPPSPSFTVNNNNIAGDFQDKKTSSGCVDGKKRRKRKAELGEQTSVGTEWTTFRESELEGCLGGF